MSPRPVGSLQALLRYPVKSMAGESLSSARVLADHGVQGDRMFALLDVATGRVASAKHPRRWSALLECEARLVDPLTGDRRDGPVRISLPGGTAVRSDDPDVDRTISAAFDREVRLLRTPPPQASYDVLDADAIRSQPLAVGADTGTFFDFAPIHLVTTASLANLARLRPTSCFALPRFRPNLVIDTLAGPGFPENEWIGQTLAIGDEVELCITFPCPRCVMTTLAQGSLAADPEVLRTLAAHNLQLFALLARKLPALGVYATVVRGGIIYPGDRARLTGAAPLRRAAAFVHAARRALRRR